MFYRVLHTNDTAARYIKSISLLSNEVHKQVYGCVPNGAIGISVVLNGTCYIKQGNRMIMQPKMFVYGLVRQIQWHMISPGYKEVTIVFHPHHLQLFLKERLSDFGENESVNLYDLFTSELVDQLYENLSRSATDDEIIRSACAFLKGALLSKTLDPRVAAAHELIYERKLRKAEEIGQRLNISAVRLRELFRDFVGISPKELIKIRRINEALRIREVRDGSLTSLAYRLDYFDQAHFIHDFKQATGLTPGQYSSKKNLSHDFYQLGRWDYKHFLL